MTHKTNIYDGETCEYCQGSIVEKQVDLPRKNGSGFIIVENVPAGVCVECGTRYYAAEVLKSVEKAASGQVEAKRELVVPVYSL